MLSAHLPGVRVYVLDKIVGHNGTVLLVERIGLVEGHLPLEKVQGCLRVRVILLVLLFLAAVDFCLVLVDAHDSMSGVNLHCIHKFHSFCPLQIVLLLIQHLLHLHLHGEQVRLGLALQRPDPILKLIASFQGFHVFVCVLKRLYIFDLIDLKITMTLLQLFVLFCQQGNLLVEVQILAVDSFELLCVLV